MINFLKKRRVPSSILGLVFDGSRFEAAALRRINGTLQIQKTLSVPLALNLLTDDPELVGREIRNQLDTAGIRERRCVVCLPLPWALTLGVKLPELPEADVASFLEIEAERGFPYGLETLSMVHSRAGPPEARTLPPSWRFRRIISRLQQALKAAQLRPASFTLGITTLQGAANETDGVLTLMIGERDISLQVDCGGGVASLRVLDGVVEAEGAQKQFNADGLAREIRITLGQLPPELRDTVRKVKLYGEGDFVQRFMREMAPRLEAMGMEVELALATAADNFAGEIPPGLAVSPALTAAARQLRTGQSRFEFLPPKISPWVQVTGRFSSKKLAWSAAIGGSIVLLVLAAFLVQQWQLSGLESKWTVMEPKKTEIADMQQQIKKYRPWFDESFRSLSIMKKLTEAFPEDGAVSVKTLEIREPAMVTCTGTARDIQALFKVRDQLRATKQISDLKIDSVRGKTPLQFTFNFHWLEKGANEN